MITEKVIIVISSAKSLLDPVVLFLILNSSWPFFIHDTLQKKDFLERGDLPFSILLLLGMYALFYHILEKAIEVFFFKGNLSLAGKILFYTSFSFYLFIIVSSAVSVIFILVQAINQFIVKR
ncbi:MAG: hypothetical protein QW403_03525 [Candidatus Aenigmatarchaeota archaeon]